MKLDEIKSDHVKTINSLDIKIPSITSNNPSLSYEKPSADLTKTPLLKSPDKSSHASQFFPLQTLKATLYFNFKNDGMTIDLNSANPY